MSPIFLILIILLLFGGFGSWRAGWDHTALTGGIGGAVVLLIVLYLLGVI